MTQDISDEAAQQWPVGGYAPGNYQGKCNKCGAMFEGDKRAYECPVCVIRALSARLKEVEAERDSLIDAFKDNPCGRNMWRFWADKACSLTVKRSNAEARLAIARADALREAYDIILSERVRGRCNDSLWAAAKRVGALIDQPTEKEQNDDPSSALDT